MATYSIKCPECGNDIPLEETILGQIKSEIAPELHKELKDQLDSLKEREDSLIREKETYDKQVKKEVKAGVEKVTKELSGDMKVKAREEVDLELRSATAEIKSLKKDKDEYAAKILEEQDKTRDAAKANKDAQLSFAGKLNEREEAVRKEIANETTLKDQKHLEALLSKDKTISDMAKKLEEAQKTGAQGSQQLQGEVKELALEDLLRNTFPQDEIIEVKKGTKGGDVIHNVVDPTGEPCGTILWESKNAKSWSDGWVSKLKGDQLEAKAEVAVIYTAVLPKDVTDHYTCIDGVYVVDRLTLLPVADTIRSGLIEIARTKKSEVGKDMKLEMLYNFLTSNEFAQRMGMMITTYNEEREQLLKERRQATKNFNIRETLLQKNEDNLIAMFGRFKGIAGASIPEIEELEIKELPESTNSHVASTAEE